MIQIKNFLIKRELSQACLSFAKREKSRLLAKTILTLVALLAVTTGAWAQADVTWTYADIYSDLSTKLEAGQAFVKDGIKVEMKIYPNLSPLVEITADNFNVYGGAGYFEFTAPEGKKFSKILLNGGDCYCQWNVAAQISGAPATWEGTEPAAVVTTDPEQTGFDFMLGSPTTFEFYFASAPSGPEVAWNKAEKTGSFTMPGGNVELEPEYYPQAALTAAPTAINDVPATTDGAIVEAGTVANIGSTTTAQGTVMYYVSQTALDDAALLALAADQWKADVPTAADLAQGQAYVYYYVRGNDSDTDDENFSDGDILAANALTVTIAAAPTYAVTFAEGTDPNEWTASPATGVTKGTPVTVTYSGSKKVIGVKAEKKAAAPAGPVTYTELKGGEVLHVGDILNFSDANVRYIFDYFNLLPGQCPFTVIRANITGDEEFPTITPADDGAYYVIQNNGGIYLYAPDLSVTATSDGILITINSEKGNYRYCTVSVHEP